MLLDEQDFGADADSFNPFRLVQDPGLVKSSSFRPFGGGLAYCPGIFVAKMEIIHLTALMFERFKLNVKNRSMPFSKLDTAKPSLGVISAKPGSDIILSVQER